MNGNKQKRCPKGERRNPKTGECEKVKEIMKDPNCRACMMTGRGRRPQHTCIRDENGKLVHIPKPKSFQKPPNLNIYTPSLSHRKPCMACVKYEPGFVNPKTKICEASKQNKSKVQAKQSQIISVRDEQEIIRSLQKKIRLKKKMKLLLQKAVQKVRNPENLEEIRKIDVNNYPGDVVDEYQKVFRSECGGDKRMAGWFRFILSKYRHVCYPLYKVIDIGVAIHEDTKKVFHAKILNDGMRLLAYDMLNAKKYKSRFLIYQLSLKNTYMKNKKVTKTANHRNLLVFDLKKNTYYRFEPHGWGRLSTVELDDVINWNVIWSFENAHLIEKAENSPNSFKFNFFGKEPEYIKPKDILPEIGPQMWESYAKRKGGKSEIGKCQIWCLAYMHHVVHYPNKSPKEICFMLGYKSDMARRYILKYMIFFMNNIYFHQYFNSQMRPENNNLFLLK